MPHQTLVEWNAPNGEKFRFEFELEKDDEAPSVKIAQGSIFTVPKSGSDENHDDSKESSSPAAKKRKTEDKALPKSGSDENHDDSKEASSPAPKERKAEDTKDPIQVGYLSGYLIRRNNARFHLDGDILCQELHEFTVGLYDSRGSKCRIPKSKSELGKIPASKGGMLLIEKVEIRNNLKGMDLGIHFIHEFLNFCKVEAGVCVMSPYPLSESWLQYEDNEQKMKQEVEGKSESERVDISRSNTIKLRRQFYRMGFRVIQNTPQFYDKWFLSMEKYKSATSEDAIKNAWLSKEEAKQVDIPMKAKQHVETEHDRNLKDVLEGIFSQSQQGFGASFGAAMMGMSPYQSSAHGQMTHTDKRRIQELVQAGASPKGIHALHLAAANYKSDDLFDYLINECDMNLDEFDESGYLPLHVAVGCSNLAAVRILLNRGADKKAKNQDGETPKQMLQKQEQSMQDFSRVFGIGLGGKPGSGFSESDQIKQLLR